MITCKKCLRQYDETIAAGICPYCGCENTEALPVQAAKKPSDPRWLRAGTVLNGRYEVVQVIGKKIVLYKPAKDEAKRKIVLP